MSLLRSAWAIARKDFAIEAHTREILVSTALFATLVAVMASLSFYLTQEVAKQVAPGVLWIAVTFAGVLGMGRSWAREREHGVMRALILAPIPPASIFLGKALSTCGFLLVIDVLLLPLVALFFHLPADMTLAWVAAFLVLGTVGFSLAGSLFAALTVKTRARELMLSVVVFPMVTPALLAGVLGTRDLLTGVPLSEANDWLMILGAFDLLFLGAGMLIFDALITD